MSDPVLTRCAEVVEARISDEEIVLLGPQSHDYFGLDAVAADVWGRLARPMTFDALVADLAGDYDATEAEIAADLAPVIETLVEGGLIRRAAPGAAPAGA